MTGEVRTVPTPARASWRLQPSSSTASGGSGSASKPEPEAKRLKGKDDPNKGKEKDKDEIMATGEAPDRRKRPRGGRRGRRGDHKDKSWTSKDPQLRDLLMTMVKLTLNNTHKLRMVTACVFETVGLATDHPVICALADTVEAFKQKVGSLREANDTAALKVLGPPTADLALTLIEILLDKEKCDIGGRAREPLQRYMDQVQ